MRKRLTRVRLGEGLDQSRTDWKRVHALTDEDIAAAIRDDPDTFEIEPEWFEHALMLRPARPKERITVRLDADMLDWFRTQGKGYQTRMNAVLRAYYESRKKKDGRRTKNTRPA